jgi:hypothetical protein
MSIHPVQMFRQWTLKFPNQEPPWNKNNSTHRGHRRDLKNLIMKGIREAVPWPQTEPKQLMSNRVGKKDPLNS